MKLPPWLGVCLSGLLSVLCFPSYNHGQWAWFVFVPMLWGLSRLGFREAFLWSFVAGSLAGLGTLYWVYPTCRWGGVNPWVSALALAGLAAHLGLFWGVFGLGVRFFSARPLWERPFWAAALWTVVEGMRGTVLGGFPWLTLATSQWQVPKHLALAEIGGASAISFLVILFNGTLATALEGLRRRSREWKPVLPGAIALALLTSASVALWRRPLGPAGPAVSMAVVQGNIDQYKKWDAAYEAEIVKAYSELTSGAARGVGPLGRAQSPESPEGAARGVGPLGRAQSPESPEGAVQAKPSVVIWPETAVPGWIPNDERYTEWVRGLARETQTALLIGAVSRQDNRDYNAAFLISARGDFVGQYRKQHLVPFGEYVPLRGMLAPFVDVLNALGTFDAGREATVLPLPGAPLGVNICFEDLFAHEARRFTRRGAQVLVNITNDGWYRDTAAPEQHFAANVLRAVENRRWVVRAANTGISGFISPRGEIMSRTELMKAAVLLGQPAPHSNLPFYVRFGDVFLWFCGLFVIAGVFVFRLRSTRFR